MSKVVNGFKIIPNPSLLQLHKANKFIDSTNLHYYFLICKLGFTENFLRAKIIFLFINN